MRKPFLRLLTLFVVALALTACHKNEQQQLASEGATPEAAITSAVAQLKAADFDSLWQHLLPPADYQQLRADWSKQHQRAGTDITDSDRQRFAQSMQRLTQPDAKKKLYAKLEPQLDAWPSKYKKRLPMVVGIFRIMVGTRITQSDTLTGKQKTQARGVLDAVSDWAQSTDWGDKAKAKQAVDIVVDTARGLKLKTLDQAYQLDYPQAMQRYDTAWKGFRQLLAVYGLSMDAVLDSVQVKTLSQKGDTARVEVDYSILDKPMSSTLDMVRQGKRWYIADVIRHWREEQAKLAGGGSVAHASSVPTGAAPAATASAPAAAGTR